ncbi:MAG: aminoacetone oxidase family FAD-binding enzyme, partial [Bacteroidales bacterium]|nr:aminoacetone oxidase family FAD-binding enzyme [Bacteroidales bacterium]
MKADIIVIGAGASGLMAAYSAAKTLVKAGSDASVVLLEKMPRAARKVMITGKGRCNFTNLKDWNEFSSHIRSKPNLVKSAFYSLPPQAVIDFFEAVGMSTVVERGDRAFPASYHASDVVDALVRACHGVGVKIIYEAEVQSISPGFELVLTDGIKCSCARLIVATGGLSYPSTGSSGDGLNWAKELNHKIEPTFPSLTALVPRG